MDNETTTAVTNTQGQAIVAAIKAGFAAMTPARWREEKEKAEQDEAAGEWFAPEFEAAVSATEGISWDFAGWEDTLYCVERFGKLGGVVLLPPAEVSNG